MTEHVELPADWREQINTLSLAPSKIPALIESWRPVPSPEGGDSAANEAPAGPKNAPKILLQVLQQAYDAGSEGESVRLRDMAERFLAGWRPTSSVRDTAETAAWTPKPGDRVRGKNNGLYGIVKYLEPVNQVVVTIEDGEVFEEGCWSISSVEPAPAVTVDHTPGSPA